MKQVTLNINSRTDLGRTAAKHMRQNGLIPAVIYGESGNKNLTVNAHEFAMAYRTFSGRAALLELKDDDDATYAIIQELQRNSCTDAFIHIDFKEIVRGQDMETDIPVQAKGIADGVRNYGGVLEISAHTLRVRCRPRALPEYIVVEVSELLIGKSIRLSEIEAPEGVEFLDDAETVVVGCMGASSGASEEPEEAEEEGVLAEGEAIDPEAETSEEKVNV